MIKRFSLLMPLIASLFAYLLITSPAPVAALSEGCIFINEDAKPLDSIFEPENKGVIYILLVNLEAGEAITYSAKGTGSEGGFDTGLFSYPSLEEIFSEIVTLPFDASSTIIIPEDGEYIFRFIALARDTGGSTLEYNFSCGELQSASAPDDRVNYGYGDVFTVAYSPFVDDTHNLDVYCADEELAFSVSPADVAGLTPTTEAQLIAAFTKGTCSAEFYLLSSGEYQLNIYAPEGKLYTLIDIDLDFRDARKTYFDPNE